MFFIISGSSGVGKNTIIRELIKRNPQLIMYKTCTTRGRRAGEETNSDYIHLSREEFLKKIENGELFEYEEIHGNLYGTLNSSIEIMRGDNLVIKDIGVEGKDSFKNKLPKDIKVVSIFLYAPKDVLLKRLIERGEANIEKRMQRFDYENSLKNTFDYIIDNKDKETTVHEIEKIIFGV